MGFHISPATLSSAIQGGVAPSIFISVYIQLTINQDSQDPSQVQLIYRMAEDTQINKLLIFYKDYY